MQFTHLALALFAAIAVAAPAADPSDIFEPSTSTPATDAGPVTIGIPHGGVVPMPQACCVIKVKGKSGGTYIGCGKACDRVSTTWG